MHEVLVNRLGGLKLTDRPDMTIDVYRGRNTTITTMKSAAGPPGAVLSGSALFAIPLFLLENYLKTRPVPI